MPAVEICVLNNILPAKQPRKDQYQDIDHHVEKVESIWSQIEVRPIVGAWSNTRRIKVGEVFEPVLFTKLCHFGTQFWCDRSNEMPDCRGLVLEHEHVRRKT